MIQMLEGKRIDLGLNPQDFFEANELPIKTDIHELKTWFASQIGNVTIPIVDVWDCRCALA
jgi:hypothetical protein